MKEIPLTQGKKAIIDDKDYNKISKYKWYLHNRGYAVRKMRSEEGKPVGKKYSIAIFMHHSILNGKTQKGFIIDHKNGNKLDNRRSNLRTCTQSQNCLNSRAKGTNKNSGIKGISWHEKSKCWYGRISIDGKTYCTGYSKTIEEAIKKYNQKIKGLKNKEFIRKIKHG